MPIIPDWEIFRPPPHSSISLINIAIKPANEHGVVQGMR